MSHKTQLNSLLGMLPPSSFIHTCLVWVKRRARLLGLLAFLLLLMALAHFSGLRGHFNLAYLRGILEGHPVLGLPLPIALYCIFFEQLARLMGIAR